MTEESTEDQAREQDAEPFAVPTVTLVAVNVAGVRIVETLAQADALTLWQSLGVTLGILDSEEVSGGIAPSYIGGGDD